ncbi:hypothetical protein [Cupriavidus basilensis]|nr:hypothetical protein [Cupriavidus basilensis]
MNARVSFSYPFDGHPAPIPRVGLFAFMPDIHLKLFGVSVQAAFAETGAGNAYRRLMRLAAQGNPREKLVLKALNEMLEKVGSQEATPAFIDDLKRAIAGCIDARQHVESLTFIETLFWGLGIEVSEWQRRHCYLAVLERSGWRTQQLLEAGDAAGAADFMTNHSLLSALLWPEALEVLRKAPNLQAVSALTTAMSMDAHLGWLAGWDLDDGENKGLESPQFACLIPSRTGHGRNPASLLFDELKRRLRVSSVSAMMNKASDVPELEIGTLYRWSSGKHFPDPETMAGLMAAHGLEDSKDRLYRQHSAAKLINLLGYLGQTLSAISRENGEPPAMWPWPAFPFGHPDFESWAAVRYPYWLAYHREKGAVLAELAKAAHGTSCQ